ncbi:MAG: hypothetical protein EOO75_11525 [Myxococcales bacterium]|nr:MAG: hypothetical protein EOO75_11525 [Myxococcales bacterium]
MVVLNITYNGLSIDYPLETDVKLSDTDVRRIAVEVIRSGHVHGLHIANLSQGAFNSFVVDRFHGPQNKGQRIYLRPRVPFGA